MSKGRALELIEEARVRKSTKLSLRWLDLRELPNLSNLVHVTHLDVTGNASLEMAKHEKLPPNLERLTLYDVHAQTVPPAPMLDVDASVLERANLDWTRVVGLNLPAASPDSIPLDRLPNLENLMISSLERWNTQLRLDAQLVSELLAQASGLKGLEFFNCRTWTLPDLSPVSDTLRSLRVLGGDMTEVPEQIRALTYLEKLALIDLGIETLPKWVFELQCLRLVNILFNEVAALPTECTPSPTLTQLHLRGNPVRELPAWLALCNDLQHLSLDPFEDSVPPVVWEITNLASLTLACSRSGSWVRGDVPIKHGSSQTTQLTTIPADILRLPNLSKLTTWGLDITTPPMEVVSQGVEAVRAYWLQRQAEGTDHLCEAKLIIVGEAGAGKTSLANKIVDPDFDLDAHQPSTEGIDILRWSFPTTLHPRTEGAAPQARDFAVNIWDFGGQEIYHSTHQFFLTRRSVYVLVADTRKEDTDFHYWLEVVSLLSDGSPIVIVKNEKQDRSRELDEGRLRARFDNLVEVMSCNLATNRGLDDVVRRIRGLLEGLPHVGDALPTSWKRVRERLESDARDTMTQPELLDICSTEGFSKTSDALHLSGYLHDLGVHLHFQRDPVLKNLVILRPTWGTDAVYRVLDDAVVAQAEGRFDRSDLERIWHEPEFEYLHDELLQLMRKFELCYPLAEGIWIAPQLLGQDRPDYRLGPGAESVLRFEYPFMPKGMLTRFTVATHELVADQGRLAWRWGVVLQLQDSRCEVIEDYPRRRITLRARGVEQRTLLGIAHREFARIHKSFRDRLVVHTLIPCQCAKCKTRAEPYTFQLEELRRAQEANQHVQCRESFEMMDPGFLQAQLFANAALDTSPPRREVFLSYAWRAELDFVDALADALGDSGIHVRRDKDELSYRDSIGAFMRQLGAGRAVVIVISAAYLRSKYCMYELIQLASSRDFSDRIFPVVLDDAEIFDPLTRLDVIEHWEEKIGTLDQRLKKLEGSHLSSVQEELSLYRDIRAFMDRIVEDIADMNTLTQGRHLAEGFESLVGLVNERLAP